MLDKLALYLAAHHVAVMVSLGLVASAVPFVKRLAPWIRAKSPRVYAFCAGVRELSPEFLQAGKFFLAIASPRLLDEIEKVAADERITLDGDTPTRPIRAIPPPPPSKAGFVTMRALVTSVAVVVALLAAMAWAEGCGGGFHAEAVDVSNRSVIVINAGTQALLSEYCMRSMAAIGRVGAYRQDPARGGDWHCMPSEAAMVADEATPALSTVRAQWAPVIVKAQAVIDAQHALAALLNASTPNAAILAKLGDLVSAYQALRDAVDHAGLPDVAARLPELNP